MGILRKRPMREESEVSLDDLVAPYSTKTLPTAPAQQAMGAARCTRCGRTVMYDARRGGPGPCPWCEYDQRIDLDQGDRIAIRDLRRAKRSR